MTTATGEAEVAEALARGILDVVGRDEPLDPHVLAAANKFKVVSADLSEMGDEAQSNLYTRRIRVEICLSYQARCAAVAHELIELLWEKVGAGPLHESVMERGARALMMPFDLMHLAVKECGPDIMQISEKFPLVPPAHIAARISDVEPGFVCSRWVKFRRVERWVSDDWEAPAAADWLETGVLASLYNLPRPYSTDGHGDLAARGWRTSALGRNAAVIVCFADPMRLRREVPPSKLRISLE
jgi:hypothetical protein